MGEAKRRRDANSQEDAAFAAFTRRLTDEGLVIEAGFDSLRSVFPPNVPPKQLAEMRACFFAGAQHLFASIVAILDEDHDETAADLRRMDQIHAELARFGSEFRLRYMPSTGSG